MVELGGPTSNKINTESAIYNVMSICKEIHGSVSSVNQRVRALSERLHGASTEGTQPKGEQPTPDGLVMQISVVLGDTKDELAEIEGWLGRLEQAI